MVLVAAQARQTTVAVKHSESSSRYAGALSAAAFLPWFRGEGRFFVQRFDFG